MSGVILSSPRLPMVDWRFVLVVGTAIHLTFFFTFRLGAWVSDDGALQQPRGISHSIAALGSAHGHSHLHLALWVLF